MRECSSCGQKYSGKKKICDACIELLASRTWKIQMRIYSLAILLGMVLLAYDYSQFTNGHYGLNSAPLPLLILLAAGGLGLMGGLFGLALAAFFSILHKRANT